MVNMAHTLTMSVMRRVRYTTSPHGLALIPHHYHARQMFQRRNARIAAVSNTLKHMVRRGQRLNSWNGTNAVIITVLHSLSQLILERGIATLMVNRKPFTVHVGMSAAGMVSALPSNWQRQPSNRWCIAMARPRQL